MAVLIIAEAGVNHNGSLFHAHRLVDEAKATGADACKFQLFNAEKLEPPGARRDMLKGLQLGWADHHSLKAHCDGIGIEYLCTPFDVESLEFLVGLGVKRIKIASGASEELKFAAANTGLPLIVSTGMGGLSHWGWQDITWLHCVSAYPAPAADMNLKAMVTQGKYGLSDHTLGNTAAIAATALGASVIEKHITLDRNLPGPDHHMSTAPGEFKSLVEAIRETEAMLGDGIKRVMPSEEKTIQIVKEREAWRGRQ